MCSAEFISEFKQSVSRDLALFSLKQTSRSFSFSEPIDFSEVKNLLSKLDLVADKYLHDVLYPLPSLQENPAKLTLANIRGNIELLLSHVSKNAYADLVLCEETMGYLQTFVDFLDAEINSASFQSKVLKNVESLGFPTKSVLALEKNPSSFVLIKTFFRPDVFPYSQKSQLLEDIYLSLWFSCRLKNKKCLDAANHAMDTSGDFLVVPTSLAGVFYWNFCLQDKDFVDQELSLHHNDKESYTFPLENFKGIRKFTRNNFLLNARALLLPEYFDEVLLPASFSKDDLRTCLDVIACFVEEGISLPDAFSAAVPLQE